MSDMCEIHREVIEHKLDIDPVFKPIKQKEKKIHTRKARDHSARS
jgi:hypothetical protein